MEPLRPFFKYFGSKYRSIKYYPKPLLGKIKEPFAGSATYSLYYYDLQVELYDLNEDVCAVWDYLIHAKESELRSLPGDVPSTVEELHVCAEAKKLIGLCIDLGSTNPKQKPSAWMRRRKDLQRDNLPPQHGSFWDEYWRDRVADQVHLIRHWKIKNISYRYIPDEEAVWFIDPPYQHTTIRKAYRSNTIDYRNLGEYCQNRSGQVMVCEQYGATWLPFVKLCELSRTAIGSKEGNYIEAIWTKNCPETVSEPVKRITKCQPSASEPTSHQNPIKKLVRLGS